MSYWFGLIFLLFPFFSQADAVTKEVLIPGEVGKELNQLLGFVGPKRSDPSELKPEMIAGVLRFLALPKEKGVLYHPDGIDGTPSAYFEMDIARSLGQILRLTDNPDVPAVFTAPSTVRMARWKSVDTGDHRLPKLWELLAHLNAPFSFSGVEHLVNTPDQTTGAYYEYDLDRRLILTKVDGRNLLISLSKQKGVSEVGKRGLIMGRDDQWDYLYTGQAGLNRFGLGWVDSYMYTSCSVAFYLESAASSPTVRFGVFKWLKAGWSNINLVKRTHIHDGLRRYASVLKQIVEDRRIADLASWSKTLSQIQQLRDEQLRPIVQAYLSTLKQRAERDGKLSADELKTLFQDGGYLRTLGREEMQSIVVVEYLKQLLGKQPRVDLQRLLAGIAD